MENNIQTKKPNKVKETLVNFWNKVLCIFDKISLWMDKGSRTTVIFLLPYVLMFFTFIVLPIEIGRASCRERV